MGAIGEDRLGRHCPLHGSSINTGPTSWLPTKASIAIADKLLWPFQRFPNLTLPCSTWVARYGKQREDSYGSWGWWGCPHHHHQPPRELPLSRWYSVLLKFSPHLIDFRSDCGDRGQLWALRREPDSCGGSILLVPSWLWNFRCSCWIFPLNYHHGELFQRSDF